MKKYDFVRVTEAVDEEMKDFVGAEGMIIQVDEHEYTKYPIEVCLFDKKLQAIIVDEGNLHFKESELEIIRRDD